MVLYRFAFPSTLNKVEIVFGIWNNYCSQIISHGVTMLHAKFGTRLYEFDTELVLGRLQLYMDAIKQKVKVLSVHVLDYLMEQCILFLARIPKKDLEESETTATSKGRYTMDTRENMV